MLPNALRAAFNAFRFYLQNPGEVIPNFDTHDARMMQYRLGWNAYTNNSFSQPWLNGFLVAQGRPFGWEYYADRVGLYERTHGFKNPTTRIVDFYVGTIYQGVLSEDGAELPDGQMLAIPICRDTPPELKAAIAQTWQWGNWAEEKSYWVLLTASMGDGPIEIVDDVAAGKVYQRVLPPAYVKEIEFNMAGDVVFYKIEYTYYDRGRDEMLTYCRTCDGETITTWDDNTMEPVVEPNPYGFVPMVWARHRKVGGNFGAPAVRCWDKIERLNSVMSQVDAYLRMMSKVPQVYIGKGETSTLNVAAGKQSESDVRVMHIKGDGHLVPFANNLEVSHALDYVKLLIDEIEQDHPETTMYEKLAKMHTLTGPAAVRVLGNVEHYVQDARNRYDTQYIKLVQMMVAIGGMRYQEGREGWAKRSEAQKLFAPFGLDSYGRGDLNFTIDARPLVPETFIETEQAKMAHYQRVVAGEAAGFSAVEQMKLDGASDDEIADHEAEAAQEALSEHAIARPAPGLPGTPSGQGAPVMQPITNTAPSTNFG